MQPTPTPDAFDPVASLHFGVRFLSEVGDWLLQDDVSPEPRKGFAHLTELLAEAHARRFQLDGLILNDLEEMILTHLSLSEQATNPPKRRWLERARLLLAHGTVFDDASGSNLKSALIISAECGWLEGARLLFEQRGTVEIPNSETTPLIEACRWRGAQGMLVPTCVLFHHGGATDHVPTATMLGEYVRAVGAPHEVARFLLENGADPNVSVIRSEGGVVQVGITPLVAAVCSIDPELVKMLLDAHADPNVKMQDKCTALHIAVRLRPHGQPSSTYHARLLEVVQHLLAANADPYAQATDGSPLEIAAGLDDPRMVACLLERVEFNRSRLACAYDRAPVNGESHRVLETAMRR